jgi:hypothetical protein
MALAAQREQPPGVRKLSAAVRDFVEVMNISPRGSTATLTATCCARTNALP